MHAVNSREFKKTLSRVPKDYYHKGVESNFLQKTWHSRKWKTLNEFLRGSKGSLLDIGCADGTTTRNIKQRHPKLKITGVDLYDSAIKYAKSVSSDITFITADVHKLPFGNKTFNAVVAVEVLEHLHEPEQVLTEINRVLKPGGTFIVGQDTDSLLFKMVWWVWGKMKGSVWDESHISCITPDILIKRIKKAGFKVEKVRYINLGMEVFLKATKKS